MGFTERMPESTLTILVNHVYFCIRYVSPALRVTNHKITKKVIAITNAPHAKSNDANIVKSMPISIMKTIYGRLSLDQNFDFAS